MSIDIKGLLEVISLDRVTEVLLDAFTDYPKLKFAFPEEYARRNALELTIRYYGQFDMFFGNAYTLDEDAFEIALIVHSKENKTSKSRCLKAGCYSIEYQEIKTRMPVEDRKKRLILFKELEKLEKKIPMPKDHLYLDFLGVAKERQGEGRGSRLLGKICDHADSVGLPIILFTSDKEGRKFYKKFDFEDIESVTSEKFGFTNYYMIREPKPV